MADSLNVVLSVHAPYYINLNAEGQKRDESIERIVESAKKASLMNAKSVVFHPGYYLKYSKEKTFERIKKSLEVAISRIEGMNAEVMLRPESTGKPKQFGDLNELIKLCHELKIIPCVDFSHIHARYGRYNSYGEFCEILEELISIDDSAIKNMHIHVSGIDYTLKGEKSHLNLKDSDFNYRELLAALKDFKAEGVVICESPNLEEDAILLKMEYKNL
jgi:deoxyribonuclease-4